MIYYAMQGRLHADSARRHEDKRLLRSTDLHIHIGKPEKARQLLRFFLDPGADGAWQRPKLLHLHAQPIPGPGMFPHGGRAAVDQHHGRGPALWTVDSRLVLPGYKMLSLPVTQQK